MAYIEEFQSRIRARNYPKIIELWHEFCGGQDSADAEEIIQILTLLKESDFAKSFGESVEAVLPLAIQLENDSDRLEALKLVFDIQTTNSETLYTIAEDILKTLFSQDPQFSQKMRLVGMRNREDFQGVLSNFLLLNHIKKHNFVLHTAGWGVGEIIDFSNLREQLTVEFENLQGGKRDISYKNAFKTLLPIEKEHFLARRFSDPDSLEEEAKKDPVSVVKLLLDGVGPKTASEIKELMCDYVIFDEDYSKWWQSTRSRLKKDPHIESPDQIKEPFRLRKGKASVDDRVEKAFSGKRGASAIIASAYALTRDFPEVLKNEEAKKAIVEKVEGTLSENCPFEVRIQASLLLEEALFINSYHDALIEKTTNCDKNALFEAIKNIEILAYKKRFLALIEKVRSDATALFSELIFIIEPSQLKEYLLKNLSETLSHDELKKIIEQLLQEPKQFPEALFWYFQKVATGDHTFFQTAEARAELFEAYLTLLAALQQDPQSRDLAKKMYTLLTKGRFQVVRNFFKESTITFAKEYLLLASKCHVFSEHEMKILQSLAEVDHPELSKRTKERIEFDPNVIWTTREGYQKTHERIKTIGTVEMVQNAKEVEEARSHGDLRENAEYKAACERRSRLQSELKMLSDQFKHARIITKDDISLDTVGIGSRVTLEDENGSKTFSILGPWDADPERNILSFQSKFVQEMLGKKIGETFTFKTDRYTISAIEPAIEDAVV